MGTQQQKYWRNSAGKQLSAPTKIPEFTKTYLLEFGKSTQIDGKAPSINWTQISS
jgi:hypothetical protein